MKVLRRNSYCLRLQRRRGKKLQPCLSCGNWKDCGGHVCDGFLLLCQFAFGPSEVEKYFASEELSPEEEDRLLSFGIFSILFYILAIVVAWIAIDLLKNKSVLIGFV
jgi:hypothetical protein